MELVKRDASVMHYGAIVIGGGPAGLNGAMNLGSERIRTLLVTAEQEFGGQAGTSSMIQNCLGFPDGIVGTDLTSRLIQHCSKFDIELRPLFRAIRITRDGDGMFTVAAENRQHVRCQSIMIAQGVQYRALDAKNAPQYTGRGLSHGSPLVNASLWQGKRVGVVGGANSAAQAALFLSGCNGCHVTMFVRGRSLREGMSAHLVEHFDKAPNVDVLLETQVSEVCGDGNKLSGVLADGPGGRKLYPLDHLFVLIGATPYTESLEGVVTMDRNGFVLTDRDLPSGAWTHKDRRPYICETSMPGIFAAGDVRAGNTRKRVVTSAADGAQAAASVVQYLSALELARAQGGSLARPKAAS